jgi:hypothetical protein
MAPLVAEHFPSFVREFKKPSYMQAQRLPNDKGGHIGILRTSKVPLEKAYT